MPNLLLCMTPGMGLNVWKSIGNLNRELKPYIEYVRRGWNVKILTFDKNDIPELPDGIEVVRFPHRYLLYFLPWMHRKLGKWADLVKTNQSAHAYYYTRAARIWKRPALLRCGYVYGEYLETTQGLTLSTRLYQWLEEKAFKQATQCQVPTEELSKWIQKKYAIRQDKISIVPNFVDTELFKPISGIKKKKKTIISVGRLVSVKQYDLLIKACKTIPGCSLTIVGDGPEKQKLKNLAIELNINVLFAGNLPNEELPRVLQEHEVFAITSKREGHPKALIEAMACGTPSLAVQAIGISNLIEHGKNGIVVDPSTESIKDGLNLLFNNNDLRKEISYNARQFALTNYSFVKVIEKEFDFTISE